MKVNNIDKELSIELNLVFRDIVNNTILINSPKQSDRTQKNSVQSGFDTDMDTISINGSTS